MRVGLGYDVHALVEGRKLIIGGVEIPHEKGLLGHSDADVCVHALMDAMLGALALGDIGQHFPDNDMQYKDIDSLKLLAKVAKLVAKEDYELSNCDIVIAAQKPKLAGYIPQMRQNIATVSDTVAVAKRDIRSGEKILGIGNDDCYGMLSEAKSALENNYLPIGLIDTGAVAKCDIKRDTIITRSMVELNSKELIHELRKEIDNELMR